MINQPADGLIKWNKFFANKWQGRYDKAQQFMDNEVLRLCEPYVPLITSILIKSGIIGTVAGSGVVQWIAEYAQRVYYQPNENIGRSTGALRGKLWFERMKADHGKKLIESVRRFIDGY